ncbi:MAG: hypothetical protein QOD99_360 [Chthoniobacter sp.]|jgi:uncharacterized membrane protein|nr:hypothetical protein [Chthoniobacter sp.]
MIELTHPWFLLLLVALPCLALPLRRSLADMTRAQLRICTMWRAFILLLLAFSVAGVHIRKEARDVAVLFVVDDSASMSPEAKKAARDFISASLPHAGDQIAGVIGFAESASVWQSPQARLRLSGSWPHLAGRDATNIAGALTFASGSFPPNASRRLVLLSDGVETAGQAVPCAQTLSQRGIELLTVPLRNPPKPEVLVQKLEAPQRTKTGEPFDVTAAVRSSIESKATIKLFQNQFLVAQRELSLKPGDNRIAFRNLSAEGALAAFEVEVSAEHDTVAENNRAQATVSVLGQPRVLVVDGDETKLQPLAAALRAEKINVEIRGTNGLPKSLEDLQQFDLFLLSDVPALQLTRAQMDLYRSWVQDFGGGFAMLGGENSFGVGGYYKTAVEQMLPVRMEHEDREETPTVAMLIVLDRSGSMAASAGGQTKISLADQGAVQALNVLGQKDLFGVLAVDTEIHNAVPLGNVPSKAPTARRIMSITAGGGGIYIYTSLAEAFQQLRGTNAKIKHVILFSDATDAEEKAAGEMGGAPGAGTALDLATAMLANKITTSVVALGQESDVDTAFLKQLAERGSGRFYLTSDALTLPQIFSTETLRVAQSSLIEEPFMAVRSKSSPIFNGIDWTQSPLLLGYNATKPKPTADVLLATERGEPLLATWRYGLGQTAAWTSDAKARWASEWLGWPGYGKFWSQLVRTLMRKNGQSNLQVAVQDDGARVSLSIDAVSADGSFRNEVPVQISCMKPNGETQTASAEQEAPGNYRASFDLPPQGTTIFSVSAGQENENYVFGYTRSYPAEFSTSETNEALLRQLAETGHGKFAPEPSEVFARPAKASVHRVDLTPYLLSAALLLFPFDIWLRRRSWKR